MIVAALILLFGLVQPVSSDIEQPPAASTPLKAGELNQLLLDTDRAGSRVVAVGERGTIAASADGGTNWIRQDTPASVTLTAVQFVDDNLGWAVGHDELILHSRDGGQTWRRQHDDPDAYGPLLGLHMRDAQAGIAVGAYGRLLSTRDGGRHWQPLSLGADDRHIYDIAWLDNGRSVIVGESGLIALSTDNGKAWRILKSPYAGSLYGLLAWSDRVLIAFGMRGHILRSKDGGETWRSIASPTRSFLFGGNRFPDGTLYLVGANGVLLTSRNGGLDFSLIDTGSTAQYTDVLASRAGRLLLVGEQGPHLLPEPVQ
ncbi:MAG: YCF48-related protein [Candidatus Thiodiazotropha sp.]